VNVVAKTARLWQLRQILWTLVLRDLKIRYARSWLGYVWTVLDPLAMSTIYFIVFVGIFHRGDVGHKPYFLFLVIGLLGWQFFSAAITDASRALLMEAKLVRSTNLPREIWVVRVIIAKGIEYLLSLPVLAAFAVAYGVQGKVDFNWRLLYFPLGMIMEFVLLIGCGLLLAPVTALVTDTQRVIRIFLRMAFYFTPIVYAVQKVPKEWEKFLWANPLTGVLELMRAGFFSEKVRWESVWVGLVVTVVILVAGVWSFGRLERAVLKEI